MFHSLTINTLRHEVVDLIRDAIIIGKLKQGERVNETIIASQLGISRSPVREALRYLEQEGLIVSIPNRGCFVREFHEHDIREIFTLRGMLESLACELIITQAKLQDKDFEILDNYIASQHLAIKQRDYHQLTRLDADFHEYICQKSGWERLITMWRGLRRQCEVLFHQRFLAYPDYIPHTVVLDHRAIVDALKLGDVDILARLNKEINARVAEECIQLLSREKSG